MVANSTEATPRLPLVHTTDSFSFEDILERGAITPQDCTVFKGQALTYFFYGRPAFRPNSDAEPTGLLHYFPVCLIFKPNLTAPITRVFPFDSGAFHNGLYAAYLHKHMKLGDFGLEPNLRTPAKVVTQFFGSTRDYLLGKPKANSIFDPAEFEAQSLMALITAKGANNLDGRSASVEIQLAQELSISGAVAAIILPSTFADGDTGVKLKNLGVDVIPYRTFERTRPDDYTTQIANLCINYYVLQNLIDKVGP
jgi:hypothetical protein